MKGKLEKRSILWFLFISVSILCSTVLSVSAQDAATSRAVASLAIVSVEGDAEILSKLDVERSRGEARILADAWKPALPRTPLSAGDQIRTGTRGSLKLQLNDGTLVLLAGDTVAVVEELRSSRGESPQTTQIKLEEGRLSTQQSTKILGQTNQIIRTDNGTINTSLGEIEVWKPSAALPLVAMIGDLPLLAQKPPKNETYVDLKQGAATVTSSGDGVIIASSMMTPEACIDQDGIKFMLSTPNKAVTITKIEDENAYILTSKKQFYVLVATEGTANSVEIITQDSGADIDIEGIAVAEQDANALSQIKLNPLLTVGVRTFAVKIKVDCGDTTPRGLNQFDILGDATVLRSSFGLDTERPLPSGSSGSGSIPSIPSESDTSLNVEFGGDDISCGPIIDFPLTVSNTGVLSHAENIEISILATSGSEYVNSISMTNWNIGTLPPGAFSSTVIRIETNDLWWIAEAGAIITLQATVTRETSRPDQTIGQQDTVTVSNPGECNVAPIEEITQPTEDGAEEPSPPRTYPGPPMPGIITPGALTQTDPAMGTHNLVMGATSAATPPVNGTISCGGGICGVNETCSTASFQWSTDPTQIEGGALFLFHEPTFPAIGCTNAVASRYIVNHTPGDTMQVAHDGAGTITFTFCYPFFQQSQNFSVRVVDKNVGEVSPCDNNGAFTVYP